MYYVMFCQEGRKLLFLKRFDLVMDELVDGWRLYGYADRRWLAESTVT